MEKSFIRHSSSYRDPSGYIFSKNGQLYRQVNRVFEADFSLFIRSGLYEKLVSKNLLIAHSSLPDNLTGDPEWYATLQPETIPLISYPYEWSFDMLKDAALLTLQLLRESVASGMILKDATPYNIQWLRGRLLFIDSLSFEKYNEKEPWIAYRQFCEQFLGPLLLMHYRKTSLQNLLLAWPEGVPLELTGSLLPGRAKLSMHTWLHIHLHGRISSKKKPGTGRGLKFSRQRLLNLVTSLETLISKLKLPEQKSNWSDYYDEAAGRNDYLEAKKILIRQSLSHIKDARTAADLGANDGTFSRLLAETAVSTIAADADPYCINRLYRSLKKNGEKNIQPMVIDLAYPSPAIGVNNEERDSFPQRVKVDLVMALALVHHLAIGKNIPFEMIADFFQRISQKWLLVEFVPKTDEKIQAMLSGKRDIYPTYTEKKFEEAFSKYYSISEKKEISGSGRILYLMIKK